MSLQEFLQKLPADLNLCPIERKGVGNSTGKKPIYKYRDQNLNGHQVVDLMEKDSTISAAGLWCGTKNNGIVILDVDFKLHLLKRDKSKELGNPPTIVSTRKDAAKFVYRVPREKIAEVTGLVVEKGGSWSGEVIWANQGVVAGDYPGNADGSPAGQYELTSGSFNEIPEAPAWLLAMMTNAKPKEGWISKGRTMRLTDRSEDDSARMIKECFSVIPPLGPSSYFDWVKLGMAVHSELPNQRGLDLWIDFSQKDNNYDDAEESCTAKWATFKADGKLSFGTLSYAADSHDPDQLRFTAKSREIFEELKAQKVVEWRNSVLSHEDVVKQAKEILSLDNPSEINHRMNGLAVAAGYRDRSAIEQLLLSQLEYERKSAMCTWNEMHQQDFKKNYLIPDILPNPSVVLIYGAGGDGKSMSAWTLAKHVATGTPFSVRGQLVPVKKGPVLILNGDQSEVLLQEQLNEVEMPADAPVFIQQGWQLKRYNEFCRLIEQIQPSMIIIDSLIGTSSGDSFDENKSEFAAPLYWMSKNNGVLFPATTILIIHHANKTGGFRGTSAIRDAVDETWALKKPDKEESKLPANSRLITIEKSRSGRSGTCLLMNMEEDLTFTITDYDPPAKDKQSAPDSIVNRVLQRVRARYPDYVSREELENDRLVTGIFKGKKTGAVKKALQRLVKKDLLKVVPGKSQGRGGSLPSLYIAHTVDYTRGETEEAVLLGQTPSPGTDSQWDTPPVEEKVSPWETPVGQPLSDKAPCPPAKPSGGALSAPVGQPDKYPPARDERSEEELNALLDQSYWDAPVGEAMPVFIVSDHEVAAAKKRISACADLIRTMEAEEAPVVEVTNCIDVPAEDV